MSYNNAPRSASEFVRLDSRVEIRVDILGVIFLRVLEQCEIDRVHRRFGFLVLFRLDDLIIQTIIKNELNSDLKMIWNLISTHHCLDWDRLRFGNGGRLRLSDQNCSDKIKGKHIGPKIQI